MFPYLGGIRVLNKRENVWFVAAKGTPIGCAINDFLRKLGLSRPRGSNPEPVVYKNRSGSIDMTRSTAVGSLTPHGRMSQELLFAIALAFLLSADVPGVNWVLSPVVLKDAAC